MKIIKSDKIENVVKAFGGSTILFQEAGGAQQRVLAGTCFPEEKRKFCKILSFAAGFPLGDGYLEQQ